MLRRLIKATYHRRKESDQQYHQRLRHFYSKLLGSGDLCIDVGANIGDFTNAFLSCGARVIAVEPQPSCVRHLRTRFSGHSDIVIMENALGAVPGDGEIYMTGVHTVASMSRDWIERVRKSGRFRDYQWDKRCAVKITTLDEVIQQYGTPKYIKIDVEGYELEVIKGLSLPVSLLSFEFTPEASESAIDCIIHLSGLGNVRFNHTIDRYRALAMTEWMSATEAHNYFSDWSSRKDPRTTDIFIKL